MSDFDLSGEEDWLDAQLLDGDASERNWARRALGGTSVADALAGIPKFGSLLVRAKIGPYRDWQDHVRAHGNNQSRWIRQAVAMKLAAEGAPPDLVSEWLK